MASAAQFFAKVYNKTGDSIRQTIPASMFLSAPTIVREVGKPAGDIEFELALPYDDFGYGDSDGLNLFDLVKVYVANEDQPNGTLVYQGHIEEIRGVLDKENNHVAIRLFPIDALFGRSLWKDADYVVGYSAADVDTMFSDAVDDVNTIYGATFFTKNLANPGVSITVDFTRVTHLDALGQAVAFLGGTYYWRVRPNGQVDLQTFNDSTADHKLTVGKDVDALDIVRSVMNLKNKVVVSWGGTPTDAEYTDATSVTNYGRRMSLLSEPGIGDSGSSDAKGNGEIARLKNPFTQTIVTVNSQYALQSSILPGDTVQVRNVSNGSSQMLTGVLRVVRVEYDGITAILHLADIADNFGQEFSMAIA
mgnify:CR=1 FL=1